MCGELLFAGSIHRVEQAKIDAARITQASGNERAGSNAALAAFSASLGNIRRMDAAGEAVNDSQANSTRSMDSLTTGRLSQRIRAAEELGAATAIASAAGVGGGSVKTYNETVRLMNAIQEQQVEEAFATQEFASAAQRGNAIKTAVAGLDNNRYVANLDYTQYIDHKKPSGLERALGIGLTVAATAFGGPQAGQAVAGVFEARQRGRNADFAGADSALQGAFKNGVGAARTNHVLSGADKSQADFREALRRQEELTRENIDKFEFQLPAPDWGSVTLR